MPTLQLRKFGQGKKQPVAHCTIAYNPRNHTSNTHVFNFGLYCLWAHCPACEAVSGSVTVNALRSQPELGACLPVCVGVLVCLYSCV